MYVVLVNFGDPADTLECLETLFRLDHPDFRVIVCDNGATDASFAALRGWADGRIAAVPAGTVGSDLMTGSIAKPVRHVVVEAETIDARTIGVGAGQPGESPPLVLIRSARNRGFAGGNNLGLRYALAQGGAGWFWLLNNDTAVRPDTLDALVAHVAADPDIGICGSTLVYYATPERVQALGGGRYDPWFGRFRLDGFEQRFVLGRPAAAGLDFVHGASMFVSRAFVETVGLLDERYFLYFEELDWTARAGRRFRLGHAPDSVVYHKEGRSAGSATRAPAQRSRLADYHGMRSRLLYTRRHRPWALPTVWLGLFAAFANRARRRQWDRIPMILGLMAGRT